MKLLKDGDIELIRGLYAFCPYIAGYWPHPDCPSSEENNGILLNLHNNRGAMAYGIEELNKRNPLAWPLFAADNDLKGMPPTIISVNEFDPLRDREFYSIADCWKTGCLPAAGRLWARCTPLSKFFRRCARILVGTRLRVLRNFAVSKLPGARLSYTVDVGPACQRHGLA